MVLENSTTCSACHLLNQSVQVTLMAQPLSPGHIYGTRRLSFLLVSVRCARGPGRNRSTDTRIFSMHYFHDPTNANLTKLSSPARGSRQTPLSRVGCNEGLGRTLHVQELEAKDAEHDERDASDAHDG